MKHLRKPTKSEILVDMFPKVGSKHSLKEVYEKTGIKSYNSLKAFFTYIRKAETIPEEVRIDVRIMGSNCERVK
jgi:hypothetical protein